MLSGTKRLASSDSNPVPNDSVMQSKRILVGSPFDANRAEPSFQQQQQQQSTTPLDMQRAERSRQHVRALNAQFASWIQTQLQDHPDELWEDGVQDYLNYASDIMEKFRDVVNWLKENASKRESSSLLVSHVAQKSLTSDNKENDSKTAHEKPGIAPTGTTISFGSSWSSGVQSNLLSQNQKNDTKSSSEKPVTAPVGATPSFGNSWSSGLFSNNKPPFSFGGIQTAAPAGQNAVSLNNNTTNEEDGEDDVERPSSPSVKKTEEKGIIVVHEVKCKLYIKSTDPADKDTWKDKGMGNLSIKCKEGVSKGTKESKPTIVVRNDVGKVLLNAFLYPGIKTNMQKNSIVAIFHTSGDGDNSDSVVARTFLMRTKTEEDRNKLAAVIQEYAPAT